MCRRERISRRMQSEIYRERERERVRGWGGGAVLGEGTVVGFFVELVDPFLVVDLVLAFFGRVVDHAYLVFVVDEVAIRSVSERYKR